MYYPERGREPNGTVSLKQMVVVKKCITPKGDENEIDRDSCVHAAVKLRNVLPRKGTRTM